MERKNKPKRNFVDCLGNPLRRGLYYFEPRDLHCIPSGLLFTGRFEDGRAEFKNKYGATFSYKPSTVRKLEKYTMPYVNRMKEEGNWLETKLGEEITGLYCDLFEVTLKPLVKQMAKKK